VGDVRRKKKLNMVEEELFMGREGVMADVMSTWLGYGAQFFGQTQTQIVRVLFRCD
jgi:hypothetical protein